MWNSRTKNDLIIEVWEKLDCENVGATEIDAVEIAVADRYGNSAVDSPMVIARMLADEGADLRHSEIMSLHIARASDRPYDAALRNILKVDDLKSTLYSIRNLENLRRKYRDQKDVEGLRLLRETALGGKRNASETTERHNVEAGTKRLNAEIAAWFTVWLETPEVFDDWVALRQQSPDYLEKFEPLMRSDL